MPLPHLNYEIDLWKKGYTVIGIDEVGRGAFAGPLVVGGVSFKPCHNNLAEIDYLLSHGINDSKKLKASVRESLSKIIQNDCLDYYTSTIPVAEINRIGVGKATFVGMRDVVKNIRNKRKNDKIFLLIDKFVVKNLAGIGLSNQIGIVHGDAISLSIAAASIVAKVYRDKLMTELSSHYPIYNWDLNKGYGTDYHRRVLLRSGKTKHHRTEFIKNYLIK